MKSLRLSALLILIICPSVVQAGSFDLGPADRVVLSGYARDTWRSIDALVQPSGLPADLLSKTAKGWTTVNYTSPSDIAAYLWSILAAEDLKIIDRAEAVTRMTRTLAAVEKLERSHGFFYNWYDPADGSRLKTWPGGGPVRPFLSTVDNGWLAAALMMVRNSRPQFRVVADDLLGPMNFGFFYDPHDPTNPGLHPGLLRGGFFTDDNTFAAFHYGMLNTEARIASYVGIAQGQLPPEHYFRMSRARPPDGDNRMPTGRGEVRVYLGVPVDEGYRTYRGLRIVPSWDGSMFEALMVALFVPEAEWAPNGWGINHPLYVRASIENATQDVRLPAWGASPSSIPGGGYRVYGVTALSVDGRKAETASDTVMTPHASFLALPFAPREALDNIEVLANRFKAYGSHGFSDSVDVASGRVSDCELAIDQGMIMAAVANMLVDGSIQKAFSDGKVAEVIRPLIAPEHFGSGIEVRQARASSPPLEGPARLVSRSTPNFELKAYWNALSVPLLDSIKTYPTVRRFARDPFMAFFDPE
jgi:Putative glucoamylase/Protein of unknown function (DUF3131)